MNYGMRLKEIRLENNKSQDEIASVLEIDRSTYSHYETEYQIIPIKHLIMFCNYLNISIDYILNLSNEKIKNSNLTLSAKDIGQKLKEIRKEKKLTQNKLASILNTNQSVIANYERGRNIIATPFLYTLCLKYNISAEDLLSK